MVTTATAPTAEFLGHLPVLSPEWHAARADGIGGSEIAAVLGLSRWDSRFSLWHRKAGRIPPQAENEEMEAGKRLEPALVAKFTDLHPEFTVLSAGTWRSVERPWQIANPDGLLYDGACTCGATGDILCTCILDGPVALLETKFTIWADEFGEPGTDEIPPYYLAQCRWYMDVLGLDTCYVMVFIGSAAEFREYVVRPDPADTQTMRQAAERFMADLREGRRPDIDQHGATYQAVRELNPDIDPVDVELHAEDAFAYIAALSEYKLAEAEKRRQTASISDILGTARRATLAGRTIALRVPGRDGASPFLRPGRGIPDMETS